MIVWVGASLVLSRTAREREIRLHCRYMPGEMEQIELQGWLNPTGLQQLRAQDIK